MTRRTFEEMQRDLRSLTLEEIQSITSDQMAILTAEQLHQFPGRYLSRLSPVQVGAIDENQVRHLNAQAFICQLSDAGVGGIRPEQVRRLGDRAQIGALDARVLNHLSEHAIAAMSWQVDFISGGVIPQLTAAFFNALNVNVFTRPDAPKISMISVDIIEQLAPVFFQRLPIRVLNGFSAQQASKFSAAQVHAIPGDNVPQLNQHIFGALTRTAVAGLTEEQARQRFMASYVRVQYFSPDVIPFLPIPFLRALPGEAVAEFTMDVVKHFKTEQLRAFAPVICNFQPGVIRGLGRKALDLLDSQGFTAEQWREISPEMIREIPSEVIGRFSDDDFVTRADNSVKFKLPNGHIGQLTVEQMRSINLNVLRNLPFNFFDHLSVDALNGMTDDQNQIMARRCLERCCVAKLTQGFAKQLTKNDAPTRFRSPNKIAELSKEAVSGLSADFLNALYHDTVKDGFTLEQVSAIDLTQIPQLTRDFLFALSDGALRGFTPAQVKQLSEVQIDWIQNNERLRDALSKEAWSELFDKRVGLSNQATDEKEGPKPGGGASAVSDETLLDQPSSSSGGGSTDPVDLSHSFKNSQEEHVTAMQVGLALAGVTLCIGGILGCAMPALALPLAASIAAMVVGCFAVGGAVLLYKGYRFFIGDNQNEDGYYEEENNSITAYNG